MKEADYMDRVTKASRAAQLSPYSAFDYIKSKEEFEAFVVEVKRIEREVERERCIEACEEQMVPFGLHAATHNDACIQCAEAIRKQGDVNGRRA